MAFIKDEHWGTILSALSTLHNESRYGLEETISAIEDNRELSGQYWVSKLNGLKEQLRRQIKHDAELRAKLDRLRRQDAIRNAKE
jgi:hypothetical protein